MTYAITHLEHGRVALQHRVHFRGEGPAIIVVNQLLEIGKFPVVAFSAAPDEAAEGAIDEHVAACNIPVPQRQIRSFERDLEPLIADGMCVAGFAHVVDQREASLPQRLHVHRIAGTQPGDQRLHVGVGPEPEGTCQLFF